MKQTIEPIITKVENLVVHVYSDRKAMGDAVAADVARKMKELLKVKENIRMVFASAPSQMEFFKALRGTPDVDWQRVTVFHMDEYIGLDPSAPQRFSQYLSDHLFDFVLPGKIHFIDSSNDVVKEQIRYQNLINEAPIDIICLGIGENGHIAFNDPPDARFDDPEIIRIVELDETSRQQQVNDGCFVKIDDVPTQALTLTIPALIAGENLYCIVPGNTKTNAVNKVLNGPVTSDVPASILRHHANCVLYLDKESYGAGI